MPVFTRPPKKANKPRTKINTGNVELPSDIEVEILAEIEEGLKSMATATNPPEKVEPRAVFNEMIRIGMDHMDIHWRQTMWAALISTGVMTEEHVRAAWMIAYAEQGMEYEHGGEFDLMITAAAAAAKKSNPASAFPKESKKAVVPSMEDEEEWHDEDTHGSFNPADPKCKCAIS